MQYFKKAMAIKTKIGKNLSFEKAAEMFSEDEFSANNGGDLGYFTGLMWSYPFETGAFNTKVGQISNPVRTNYGYHIIKVEDSRPARGEVRVAHILIRADKNNPNSINDAKNKIEEVYSMLKAGTSFSDLAYNYSEDANSKGVGGELPLFGINKMVPEFEEVAFSLKVNEFSEPFLTDIGFHIVKLLDKKEIPSLEKSRDDILKKIQRNVRYTLMNERFAAKLQKEYGFVENKKTLADIKKIAKGEDKKLNIEDLKKIGKLELFKLAGKAYLIEDLIETNEARLNRLGEIDLCEFVTNYYNPFVIQKTLDFEDSRLEAKYPEFDALMKEYTEGILLFNLMDQKVWSKSVEDTTGLRAFYNANKQNYLWDERAETFHFSVKDEKTAKKVLKDANAIVSGKKTLESIKEKYNKKSPDVVYVEKKLYTKGENKEVDALNFAPGVGQMTQKDGRYIFTAVTNIKPKEPKALSETKGLVISEYQSFLDNQWIKELRNKYKVEINKDVLYSIVK
jgi:peptidyl-prolyl cis-trans isomerase SurA